ncbi:hypothetical protein [Enterobacter sp. PTB]
MDKSIVSLLKRYSAFEKGVSCPLADQKVNTRFCIVIGSPGNVSGV